MMRKRRSSSSAVSRNQTHWLRDVSVDFAVNPCLLSAAYGNSTICIRTCDVPDFGSIRPVTGKNPSMIELRVTGGLGNQMFQYAAGKSLAERHGVGLAFDLEYFREPSSRPFMLDRLLVPEANPLAPSEVSKNAKPFSLRSLWRPRRGRVKYDVPHFHYDPAFEGLSSQTTLSGYFQSERYFAAIADNLRNWFLPRLPPGAVAAQMLGRIERSRLPVSVHIRRGDYVRPVQANYHGILDGGYYRDALDRIESMIGAQAELFVFSDDADAAEHVLDFVPTSRLVHVRGDVDRPWEDMALMARCHHHVVANSTFGWWGAWLNRSPGKIVIAPRAWFGPEILRTIDTRDLYPSGWIVV
jgi:hypothetical protein